MVKEKETVAQIPCETRQIQSLKEKCKGKQKGQLG